MDNLKAIIQDKLREPRNLAIAAGILGLLIGLFFAYVLFPIKWTDASAEHLRPDLRIEYLRNAITTYTLTGDRAKAQQAYAELGSKGESTLNDLAANPGFLNSEQIQRFTTAINTAIPTPSTGVANTPVVTEGDGEVIVSPEVPDKEPNSLLWVGIVLLLLLIGGAFAAYWFYFREKGFDFGNLPFLNRNQAQEITSETYVSPAPRRQASPVAAPRPMAARVQQENKPQPEARPQAQRTSIFTDGNHNGESNVIRNGPKPIAQFMTTYMFGDDRYDESFTFDAPNGAFLGECGVSISDVIGVGDPKKISAFDIWLFDKNDIQTVTKVLMSKHAYNTPDIYSRLEIRGEPILAEPNIQFVLETATLRMVGRIVDVSYGELPLPEDSYFQRNTIELAVYRK